MYLYTQIEQNLKIYTHNNQDNAHVDEQKSNYTHINQYIGLNSMSEFITVNVCEVYHGISKLYHAHQVIIVIIHSVISVRPSGYALRPNGYYFVHY